jgi:hypothetical protein
MSTNHQPSHDPLEQVIHAFGQMTIPDQPSDSKVLTRIDALDRPATRISPISFSSNSSFLLRRLVPSTVAALVLLGFLGLFFLNNTSSIALADVVKAAEMHKLVKYKVTQTTDDKRNGTASGESVMYADLAAPRYREERKGLTLNKTVEMAFILIRDGRKDRTLSMLTESVVPGAENDPDLAPLGKAAIARRFREKYGDNGRKEATLARADEGYDPTKKAQPLLESLRETEAHKDVITTKDKVRGRDAIRYFLEDGKKTIKLWVDAETKLPVQFEYQILDHTPDIALNRWTYTDFEWDPDLKGFRSLDALFDTTPPEGYTLTDRTKENNKK